MNTVAVRARRTPLSEHTIMPPCQVACPLHMDIREYVDLAAQGRLMEAMQVIRSGNPFPSICAYICAHPCEEACRRGQVDKPVAIRALKRFALEFGGDRMIEVEAETTRSERVAVVGSGPAGLACAYYLRKLGYPVTVFEAHSEVGGMLRVGIPRYRLPREVLDVEITRLTKMGVEIRTGTRVVSLDLVFDLGYRAVFLTVGAHQSLRMGIEGEDGAGVVDGATLLRELNLGLTPALGERVAVVGGGNVAMDAARSAVRLGVPQVSVLYRRTRAEMPADPREVEQALEEGIEFQYLVAPVRVRTRERRPEVTCVRMELGEPDQSGRRRPVPIAGSEFIERYDTLVTAIGQAPQVPDDFHVRIGRGSTIQVDPVTLSTNRAGVFAGGDAVTGPSTVVEALAAGRTAAGRIDDYLNHRYPLAPSDSEEEWMGDLLPETVATIRTTGRLEPPVLSREERTAGFAPVELAYDCQTATNEARRCLRCGLGAAIVAPDRCASCLTCVRVCPYHVPYADAEGAIHIPFDQCQACGICVGECPAGVIALRKAGELGQVDEELDHVLGSATRVTSKPMIVGFCCQYGVYGTGTLAGLWRGLKAGVWIVPVRCVTKVETGHLLRAFEMGAEGVFVAGCGEQCARENTGHWMRQRVAKVKRVLAQLGLQPERLEAFMWGENTHDPTEVLDEFAARVGGFYLDSVLLQEVKR